MKHVFQPSKRNKPTGGDGDGHDGDDRKRNNSNAENGHQSHKQSTGDISACSTTAMDGSHSSRHKKSLRGSIDGDGDGDGDGNGNGNIHSRDRSEGNEIVRDVQRMERQTGARNVMDTRLTPSMNRERQQHRRHRHRHHPQQQPQPQQQQPQQPQQPQQQQSQQQLREDEDGRESKSSKSPKQLRRRRRRDHKNRDEMKATLREEFRGSLAKEREREREDTTWAPMRRDDAPRLPAIPAETVRLRQMRAEQDDLDRALKQSIKEQRHRTKSSGSTARSPSLSGSGTFQRTDPDFDAIDMAKLSIAEDDSIADIDERFRSGTSRLRKPSLDDGEPFQNEEFDPHDEQTQTEERIRQNEQKQNWIDLHMAQFLATNRALKESSLGNSKDLADGLYDDFDEDYDTFDVKQQLPSLSEFEEEQRALNRSRRKSRRTSETTMKINAWHQKYALKKAMDLAERSPEMEWLSSFYRCDPRWQIMKFFDEVAREGGDAPMDEDVAASPLMNLFQKANVFTVWRPTSLEAIKNMMLGIATGKGLDIKGKSAKRGNISSYGAGRRSSPFSISEIYSIVCVDSPFCGFVPSRYFSTVPFIQIYEEQHKEHVRAYIKDGRTIRVFYQDEASRMEAYEMINDVKDFMLFAAKDAMQVLSDEYADPSEQELAMKHLMYDDSNLGVFFIDTYANADPPCFGLEITERLFWESYVMMSDCSRPPGTEWDIGRNSELTFMGECVQVLWFALIQTARSEWELSLRVQLFECE